jgi:Zn-dependent peptidase ImmA (M78 family)/DNA-binding XRE family transcriptional regulator
MEIGERIKNERERLGMKLQELAKEIGFKNYQTLSAIEKCERQVKVSELDKISKALGLTVSYLLGEEKERGEKVLWRKCVNKTLCKKYENMLIGFCRNYEKLANLIGHKYEKFIPPRPAELQKDRFVNDYEFAEKLAERYLKNLDLGRYPGNNLIDALQEKNILIFCYDLGEFGSAASLVGDFGAAILLNKNDKPWRRTFDIAHEFFHLITWDVYPPEAVYDDEKKGKSEPEKYADAFASSLLLPKKSLFDEVEKYEKEEFGLIDFITIATKFKISLQFMTWRLQNLGIFSEKDMEEIRNHPKISQLNKLMRAKEPDIPELPEIYITQALKTYQRGRISKLKLAEYLNVKYGEMEALLNRYSYPDIEEMNIEGFST